VAPFNWKGLETFDDVVSRNFSVFVDIEIPSTYFYTSLCFNQAQSPGMTPSRDLSLTATLLTKMLKAPSGSRRMETTVSKNRAEMLAKIIQQIKFPQTDGTNCSMDLVNAYLLANPALPHPNDKLDGELIKCEKSVYVLRNDDVYARISTVSNSRQPVYHGKLEDMEMFKFDNKRYALALGEMTLDHLYIQTNLHALNSGGFLFYWELLTTWSSKRKYDKQEEIFQYDKAYPKRLTLSGKAGTIFIILLAGHLVGILTILFELLHSLLLIISNKIYRQGGKLVLHK